MVFKKFKRGSADDAANRSQHDPYAALRFRDFRLLIGGRVIAQIGEAMVSVAVGWELYERTNDPLALGMVGLVQIVPVMLLSLPGGYIVDRYNRKQITLISQLVLVICALVLGMLSATQGPLPLIYLVLGIIGAARAFNNPAEGALTPQMVPPEHFASAATWSSGVWQVSAIVGPAAGGLIIAIANMAAPVFFINALAGMVLVIALLMIRSPQREYTIPDEGPVKALREGIRFLGDRREILAAISLDMFAVLFGGATFLLPVFAKDILQVDARALGVMRAAPSIGALCMAMFIAQRPPFRHAGRTLLLAVIGFGVATIIFGVSQSFWLSLATLFALGALDNISVVVRHTLVMTRTPEAMRGRVGAVSSVFIGVSNELGGFESGVAAALLGPVGAVVFGGIGTILTVFGVGYFSPELRNLGRLAGEPEVVPMKETPEIERVEMGTQPAGASD